MQFFADMHTHTCASGHAYSTITENARAAAEKGIKFLGMTDHGADMQDSPHIWHFYNMRILPDYLCGVRIIRGMEADIVDYDGNIDIYEDALYDNLEWINASLHDCVCPASDKSNITSALLGALANPYVDLLSHTEEEKFDYDFDKVTKECHRLGKLIEVNMSRLVRPEGQARYKDILRACELNETYICIDSDAHFYTHIGDFAIAEEYLKKCSFPERLVINADEKRFSDYFYNRRTRIKEQLRKV